jgi:hypothetical protein
MKIIKYILAILVCFAVLNGCVRGTLNKPLSIPSTPSIDNEKATVKFYRSSDSGGSLQFSTYAIQIDFDYRNNDYEHRFNLGKTMLANRNHYSVKTITLGIHSFSISNLAKQTVLLEAGKVYYLAYSFIFGAAGGLEFRTQEDFIKDTEGDTQIELIKCDLWKGCEVREIVSGKIFIL